MFNQADHNFKTVIDACTTKELNPLVGQAFAKALEGVPGMCIIYFYKYAEVLHFNEAG